MAKPISAFSVGWPPPWVYARCLPPLLIWRGLTVCAPGFDDAEKLVWAVVGYFSFFQWDRVPYIKPFAQERTRWHAALMMMGLWAVVACLALLAPDPIWLQRWFTVAYGMMAMVCVIDVLRDTGIATQRLAPALVEKAGPQLVRGYLLLYLTLAILNETLIATLSLQAWVVCLALLPLFAWVTVRALTKTIWLSVTQGD